MIQVLLGEFYDKLNLLKDGVKREVCFPEVPNKIKVAIGMRRVGKTYFLFQRILKLFHDGVSKTAVLYLNFEDDRLWPSNEKQLAELVDAFYALYPKNHDRKCYLFLDEIQNVENWPLVVRRLHDTKNVELFLTGSSAKLLSKEIATSLRGRCLAIEIWPYSFNEFLKAKNIEIDRTLFDQRTKDKLAHSFKSYLSEGGFPETPFYSADIRQKTLQEYLDVVIYRDIIERHQIKNPTLIKYMILSMIRNVGKTFSVNKFYNELKSRGYKIGKDILYEYVNHIEDAYLSFSLPVYHQSLRKMETHPKKIYAIDPGLIRALTLEYDNDLGRLFENVIFLELRRLGYRINFYHTYEGFEIDFLVHTPRGKQKLFQVVWDMSDSKTNEREKRALEAGMNELKIEGEIITLESFLQKGITLSQESVF